jgi:hypothetical protein
VISEGMASGRTLGANAITAISTHGRPTEANVERLQLSLLRILGER